MLRAILGVIVGYIVTVIIVIGGFSILQLGLGTESVFKPGSWEPSILFNVCALVLGLIGAIIGGLTCRGIGKSATPVKVLAGLFLVFGLIGAVVEMGKPAAGPRPPNTTIMESGTNARTPLWVSFANPIIGAVGAMIGGGARKRKSPSR